MRLPADTLVFVVPAKLRMILDRDLRAAGIPKRDDRGRTIDVHALRHTFGTLLSKTGTTPPVATEAMKHSDIKLTMNVHTDPRLLDVRGAVDRLPALTLPTWPGSTDQAGGATGTDGRCLDSQVGGPETRGRNLAPNLTPTPYIVGHFGSKAGNNPTAARVTTGGEGIDGSACPVNEKAPVTSAVTGAEMSGRRDLNPRPPAPKAGDAPTETLEIQAFSTPTPTPCTTSCTNPPDEAPEPLPSSLARLLAELAALPPEQRAALAALIAPTSVVTPAPGGLDDRLP